MRNFGAVFRILVIAVLTGLVALTTVAFGPTSVAQPTAGGLTLAKSASPKVGLQSGDQVTYTFTVSNTGNAPITGVDVTERVFTGSGGAPEPTGCPTTLGPGQSATCSATYEVTDADQNACLIDNTAVATGQDPQGQPVSSAPSSASVVTDCRRDFAGSAFLPPLLGSPLLGSLALVPLEVGSLAFGSLGAAVALGAWALSTPYQPPAQPACLNVPYPNVPFPNVPYLSKPCPKEQDPNQQGPNEPGPRAP
ncbi:DUF7507 domain-containing protein [Prescottella agglutinans]|uniref:DUF7507 domain-containing protein n=1 Tax=Prescottella agglutinans TaxID=1644129 RepID=UPI003D95DEA8